jgi:hypothetical protein
MGFSFRLGDPFLRDKWIFNIDPPYYLWCDEGWDGRWRACRKQGNAENLLWVNQCFPSWGWLYLTSIWPAFDQHLTGIGRTHLNITERMEMIDLKAGFSRWMTGNVNGWSSILVWYLQHFTALCDRRRLAGQAMLQHIVFRDHCWLQDGLGRSFLDAISGSDLGTLRGKVHLTRWGVYLRCFLRSFGLSQRWPWPDLGTSQPNTCWAWVMSRPGSGLHWRSECLALLEGILQIWSANRSFKTSSFRIAFKSMYQLTYFQLRRPWIKMDQAGFLWSFFLYSDFFRTSDNHMELPSKMIPCYYRRR